MKFIAIIPARYASTRFPGKPLALLGGRPVIQHVYEKAAQALETNPAETLVFEDALYAAITAKDAGFVTVGVYDRFSEADKQTMQEKADIFLSDLRDFEKLWEIISEI